MKTRTTIFTSGTDGYSYEKEAVGGSSNSNETIHVYNDTTKP